MLSRIIGGCTGGEPSGAHEDQNLPVHALAVSPRELIETTELNAWETAGGSGRCSHTGHTWLRQTTEAWENFALFYEKVIFDFQVDFRAALQSCSSVAALTDVFIVQTTNQVE